MNEKSMLAAADTEYTRQRLECVEAADDGG